MDLRAVGAERDTPDRAVLLLAVRHAVAPDRDGPHGTSHDCTTHFPDVHDVSTNLHDFSMKFDVFLIKLHDFSIHFHDFSIRGAQLISAPGRWRCSSRCPR